MKLSSPKPKPAITAAAVPPEWLAMVAKMIADAGVAIRPHRIPTVFAIEAKLDHGEWCLLEMRELGPYFVSAEERDLVMKTLVGAKT